MFRYLESQTTYEVELPPCDADWEDGSAIVLTHFTERNDGQTSYEPDRITFCEWFVTGLVEVSNAGIVFDTRRTIYELRAGATEYEDGNGDANMDEWWAWRNQRLTQGINLPDIDMSIGFDTFLTSVVSHLPDNRKFENLSSNSLKSVSPALKISGLTLLVDTPACQPCLTYLVSIIPH